MAKRNGRITASPYFGLLTVFVMLLGILGVTYAFQNIGSTENRASAATTQLYRADFTKLWRSVTGMGGAVSRVYGQSGSPAAGVIEAAGNGSTLVDASFYLPYNLPTSGFYYTQFDAQLQSGYGLTGSIRFNTNQQLPVNSYTLWIQPSAQSWSISKYTSSTPTVLASGTNAAIKTGTNKNTFKVYRNNTTGAIDFYINGVLLGRATDATYKGGVNRVSLQSTNDVLKVTNFTVFK